MHCGGVFGIFGVGTGSSEAFEAFHVAGSCAIVGRYPSDVQKCDSSNRLDPIAGCDCVGSL